MPPERRRFLLGAFGDPGHAFPMIALGGALVSRGHDVWLQTWTRWREHVQSQGMSFAPAPEYRPPHRGPGELGFYDEVERATRATEPLVDELAPDVVVADVLTLAPALAAELHGLPWATLVPHIYPPDAPGFPIYSLGGRLPHTAIGRAFWESVKRPMRRGIEQGRSDLNEIRLALGLPALDRLHGGISEGLALVATFPQLEYPRRWPAHAHVVGPLMWEPDGAEAPVPPGDAPLVLIAPSTSQDPQQRLLRAALTGLADMPVRVLASVNRRPPGGAKPRTQPEHLRREEQERYLAHRAPGGPILAPPNATVVDWLSYSRTMPHCDVVICHAGHGTLVRALSCGCPLVACPVAGDMNENAARVDWAGAGVRLPRRFINARAMRLALERVLEDASMRARAKELAVWSSQHDAASAAAQYLEALTEPAWKLRGWDSNPQPLG